MRQRIAELLGVSPQQVNVKAKTAELLGPVGGLAMEARAVALLVVREDRFMNPYRLPAPSGPGSPAAGGY